MGLSKLFLTLKGGPNSGNHGHSGRPGKRGGSGPGKDWRLSITPEEANAIRDFTWLSSQTINSELESGKVDSTRRLGGPSNQEQVDALDSVISKAPAIKEDTTLYSKFDAAKLFREGKLEPGTEFTRNGYTSTTTDKEGRSSSPSRRYDMETVMELRVPKGYKGVADISQFSNYPQEKEFLLKRGSKFKIVEFKEGIEVFDPYRLIVELVE